MEYTSGQLQNNRRYISNLTTTHISVSNCRDTDIGYKSVRVNYGVNSKEESLCTIREDSSCNTSVLYSTSESNTLQFYLTLWEQTVSSSSNCCNTTSLIINKVSNISSNLTSSRCICNRTPSVVRSKTCIIIVTLLGIYIINFSTQTRILPFNLVLRRYSQVCTLRTNTLSCRTSTISGEQVTFGCQQSSAITDSKRCPHGSSSTRLNIDVRGCNRDVSRGGILSNITNLINTRVAPGASPVETSS